MLQPFVDQILRSRIFGSLAVSRRAYDSYGAGKNYPDPEQHGAELCISSNSGRHVKDPYSLTFLNETMAGSEENILNNG